MASSEETPIFTLGIALAIICSYSVGLFEDINADW